MQNNQPNNQLAECIRLCWECRTECHETLINECLEMGGEHVEKEHVKLMMDCIQVCQTTADLMTRGSRLHMVQCAACAEICEACAKSCESIGGDAMLRCAEICRQCADHCRKMGQLRKAA